MPAQILSRMNVREAMKQAMSRFAAAEVPSASLAAELLLMSALGRDRTWLYAHPDFVLDEPTEQKFLELIEKRALGIPTQYLTGRQEFWGLEFKVAPGVLIPRPETEHLIEVVLQRVEPSSKNEPLLIADVGTGSGCIAVAIAHEFPRARIIATDISDVALEIAARNATKLGVAERIRFVHADLLMVGRGQSALSVMGSSKRLFDVIVSNPPYVASERANQLQREVREHEPDVALYGGPDGLDVYRRLVAEAAEASRPDGLLMLELGHDSLPAVQNFIEESHCWREIQIANDLAGIPRVISAVRASQ